MKYYLIKEYILYFLTIASVSEQFLLKFMVLASLLHPVKNKYENNRTAF